MRLEQYVVDGNFNLPNLLLIISNFDLLSVHLSLRLSFPELHLFVSVGFSLHCFNQLKL